MESRELYLKQTENRQLKKTIDAMRSELEKTKIEERIYTNYEERYAGFLFPGLALILLDILLSTTFLRRFP